MLAICVCILLIFPHVLTVAPPFDAVFARNFMYPLSAAAFSTDPTRCLNDLFGSDYKFGRQITVYCDDTRTEKCSAFTAISLVNKSIAIAFRGSADDFQVIEEAGSIFEKRVPFVGYFVNAYFYNAFMALWNGGIKDDFLTFRNQHPDFDIWVTGHSLGASMASLFSAQIVYLKYVDGKQIKLVTFGQPRTGTAGYADIHNQMIAYSFRVVHAHDIVPHLPTEGYQNYWHHKSEVWFNNDMRSPDSQFVQCDEDESKQCSDSSLDLSADDHRSYYSTDVMSWANNGCRY